MTFQFQKQPGQRVLEIGCGDKRHPMTDVAVDSRQLLGVDFVVDLNLPFDAKHGQAIQDAEFDAVLSVYSLEHVSWRNFRGLLKEICRVLKPGGKLLAITANLLEQCKMFVERTEAGDHDQRWVTQIFGDQNFTDQDDKNAWLGNAHFVGFSPTSITLMLREAGFGSVVTSPLPEWKGDLVVEATKADGRENVATAVVSDTEPARPNLVIPTLATSIEGDPNDAERWRLFNEALAADEAKEKTVSLTLDRTKRYQRQLPDGSVQESDDPEFKDCPNPFPPETTEERAARYGRNYFDCGGGKLHGGFDKQLGCWDLPTNWNVFRRLIDRQPKSVLELGCGRGYILKRLQDAGVPAGGCDISNHAYMTRASDTNGFNRIDLCEMSWPLNGKETGAGFDLCFSLNFLEHVREDYIPAVVAEMERTCQRGLHGIDFTSDGWDDTKCTLRDRRWWRSKLPKSHEVVDARELKDGPLPDEVLKGDGKKKIAVGTFITQTHHGWINLDLHDLGGFAASIGTHYQRCDVRQGLPFGTGTVDLISACHFLEHLSYDDGLQFLRECRRVIKSDGAVRIVVPNAAQLLDLAVRSIECDRNYMNQWDEISVGCANRKTPAAKLWEMLLAGHAAIYDRDTLYAALDEAGFEAKCAGFRQPGFDREGCRQILRETLDVGPDHSIFCSAIPKIG